MPENGQPTVYRVVTVHEGLLGTEVLFTETQAEAMAQMEECALHCAADGGKCAMPVMQVGKFMGFNFVPDAPQ